MVDSRFDVLGVGNAIVDVLSSVDDSFIEINNLAKDAMLLIDEPRADDLYHAMSDTQEISGGSAANTLAGVANFGARAAYIGKVAQDKLGQSFAKDLQAAGVHYETPPLIDGPSTARCLIAVPPDGRRAMNTYLGASIYLNQTDIDEPLIAASKIIYLEGYLFDRPEAKSAFIQAARLAKKHGRKVSLTLSDIFCVERHRDSFQTLIKDHIDIVFANEAELIALYQTDTFDNALDQIRALTDIAAITRSEKGAVICSQGEAFNIPAQKIETLVDTTGAGDLFAAGFLTGYSKGLSLHDCGNIGVMAASEIISHLGARAQTSLADLINVEF